MNILLLGYGKMGKIIDDLATKKGHHIVARINSANKSDLQDLNSELVDVAIEFSNPESVVSNIKWAVNNQTPIVVGTTGWLDHKKSIDEYCSANNGTYLYASNFSIGVNLFFKLNETLARLMNGQPYSSSIREIHHTQKLDAPSGTAISIAEGMIKHISELSQWHQDETNYDKSSLPIKSERIDPTPGTHEVKYSSEIDTIEIKHIAHSRIGFASGAIAVAEWIRDKKGILTFDDFLDQP